MNKRVTVLYVDDELINQFIFQRTFESYFNILTATSGEEALKTLESNSGTINVVISDMRMPGMDGLTFIKKARQNFSDLAYYLLTAFSFNEEIDRAIQEQIVRSCFSKPYDVAAVRSEIEHAAA